MLDSRVSSGQLLLHTQAGSSLHPLCLILAGRPDRVAWSAFSPSDWVLLVATARVEGVAPLLCHALGKAGWPDGVPSHLRRDLQAAYYATAVRNTLLYQELSRILTALLSAAPLPVIVLKGAALATSLYPSIALRPLGDLDLLVPRRHLGMALRAVQSLGYCEAYPEMTPGLNRVVGHHVHLRGGPQQGVAVELHWSLVGGDSDWRSPPLDWFWEQTEERTVLQLTSTAHLLYLAAHLMLQHGGARARLLWYYDIHLLVSHWESRLDWDELLNRAREFRWAAALHAALQSARACFDTPVPDGFLETLAQTHDPQATRLVQRKADPLQTRAVGTWNVLMSLDWRARIHLALGTFCPGPAYMRWRYNPQPKWLWPLCYPYRWLDILREGASTLAKLARPR